MPHPTLKRIMAILSGVNVIAYFCECKNDTEMVVENSEGDKHIN